MQEISKFKATKGREIQDIEKKLNELIDAVNPLGRQTTYNEQGKINDIRLEEFGDENYILYVKGKNRWLAIPNEYIKRIKFENDRFYIKNVDTWRPIDRTSGLITATTTVDTTATETTLYTGVINAEHLKEGNLIKVFCNGELSNDTASDDITFNIYISSTLVQTYKPAIGNVTDADWHVEFNMTIRSVGATGSIAEHSTININGNEESENDASTTIDTTSAENITLKVQWDNAKAGNTISIYQGHLEFKN